MQFPTIPGFQVQRHQGSGPIGHVFQATMGKKQRCALKTLRPAAVNVDYMNWCLGQLVGKETHPHLSQIIAFQLLDEQPYVATTWVGNESGYVQTLESVCGKWTFQDCYLAIRCMTAAVAWLHDRTIIHTALTLRNVLLGSIDRPDSVVVTDIGQGCVEMEAQPIDWGTHLPYFSPERLKSDQEAKEGDSGETMDIYALGVIAYRLMTGLWPRAQKQLDALDRAKTRPIQKDILELAKQIERENQVGWKIKAGSPQEAGLRRIVEKCLARKPENRFQKGMDVLAELNQLTPDEDLPPSLDLVTRADQNVMNIIKRAAEEKKRESSTIPTGKTTANARQVPSSPSNTKPAQKPTAPATASSTETSPLSSEGAPAAKGLKSLLAPLPLGAAAAAVLSSGLLLNQCGTSKNLQKNIASLQEEIGVLKNAKSLVDASVGGVESQKQQAQAAQATAEANLRQQQGLTAKLFDSFIDAIPDDDVKKSHWRDLVGQYAEKIQKFSETHKDDPQQKETLTINRWHLGSTAQALGDLTNAESHYDACAASINGLLAKYTGKPEDNLWLPLQGKLMSRMGQIYLESGRGPEAAKALEESLKVLDSWLSLQSNDLESARERVMVLMREAQTQKLRGEEAGAVDKITRAVKELDDLMQSPAKRTDDVILLAKLHADRGKALASQKKHDDAELAYLKAYETLKDFDRKNPKYRQSREVLAVIYEDFGQILQQAGKTADALAPVKESTALWLGLLNDETTSETYCLALGRAKVNLASLQKLALKPQDSLATCNEAIGLLEDLSNRRRSETRYKLHLGIAKALAGELYEDQSKWVEAAKASEGAALILSEPGIEAGASVEEHRTAILALARSYTTLGHSAMAAKQKDVAKEAYTKAQESWQQVEANGDQTDATKKGIEFVAKELSLLQ